MSPALPFIPVNLKLQINTLQGFCSLCRCRRKKSRGARRKHKKAEPVCARSWMETFYHFSSSSTAPVSLSCNLFCRFLHHHYSRCSFMSDSDGASDDRRKSNEWLSGDGNVRITRQQRNNINENSFSFSLCFLVLQLSGLAVRPSIERCRLRFRGFWTRSQSK